MPPTPSPNYERLFERVKWMVGKVRLQRHHPLLQLCRQRLDLFCEQRGEEVFAHRTRHRSPISGSVKYKMLKRARGRCECCGAWLLLSKSRTSGPWRWTTLCPGIRAASTASATCRPSASTAMQASYGHREAGCVFCALHRRCLSRERGALPGDPQRHGADGLKLRREQFSAEDSSISGWAGSLVENRGLNSGETAGQTVFHAHWHPIPPRRRSGG